MLNRFKDIFFFFLQVCQSFWEKWEAKELVIEHEGEGMQHKWLLFLASVLSLPFCVVLMHELYEKPERKVWRWMYVA